MSASSGPKVPSRRLRVAYFVDSFEIGGTELNAVRTAEALDQARFEIMVLYLRGDGALRARYEARGFELHHFPIRNLYSPRTLTQGARLAHFLNVRQADILHTHDLYTNIFAAPFARTASRTKIISSRRWWYSAPRSGLATLNRLANRFAHRILANSPSVARLLVDEENVPENKIVEIPNFLDDNAFSEPLDAAIVAQRKRWGVAPGAFVIGIVARLAPVKNHAHLLRAMAMLDDKCHLVIIGDGPERASLAALANELGLASRVRFEGEILSRENLHAHFDLSVLCSTSEGFPNAVIEALAAARPVVATAVGGVRDVVIDQVTGRLIPAGDVAGLAAAIRQLQHNPEARARLGARGRIAVRRQYHRNVVIARISNLYDELGNAAAAVSERLTEHR